MLTSIFKCKPKLYSVEMVLADTPPHTHTPPLHVHYREQNDNIYTPYITIHYCVSSRELSGFHQFAFCWNRSPTSQLLNHHLALLQHFFTTLNQFSSPAIHWQFSRITPFLWLSQLQTTGSLSVGQMLSLESLWGLHCVMWKRFGLVNLMLSKTQKVNFVRKTYHA